MKRPKRWKPRLLAFIGIAVVSMASIAAIVAVIVSAVFATVVQYVRAKVRGKKADAARDGSDAERTESDRKTDE